MLADDIEELRFKFYIERGYFPSDNTLINLLEHKKSRYTKKISEEIVPNEDDEYSLFLSEIEKLDTNKKQIKTKIENEQQEIKHTPKKIIALKKYDDIKIDNYKEQRELFLETIRNQNYSYKDKEQDQETENKKTFKKPDIDKAIPRVTVDLHGLTRDKAYLYIKDSVLDAIENRESPMLVIHGKGLHNEYGRSLLQESLYEYILKDNQEYIEYYHKAPKHLGGSGAMLLYLKIRR